MTAAIIGHGKRKRSYASRGLPPRFVAWVEYDRDPDTGERRRVTREFARAADRDAWLSDQLREADLDSYFNRRRRVTVGDLLDRYVEHAGGAKPWSPSHARRTLQVVTRDLAPLRGIEARRLTPSRLERFYGERLRDGLAPNTVVRSRIALCAAYNLAIRDRVVAGGFNPAALSVLEVRRDPPRYLDLDQARTFLEVLRAPQPDGRGARRRWRARHDLGPLLTVATVLALRPGEALGLHWDDVDWDDRSIAIRRNVQLVDGRYYVRPPKADSDRTIPLPDPVVGLLTAHQQRQRDQRIASVVVFPNTTGGYLNEPMVNRRLATILEDAELPRIPFYGLRHTGATVMLAMGIPAETIREIMGHSSVDVTLRYAHVTAPLRREAAQKLGQLFAPDRSEGGTTGGTGKGISQETGR